MSPPESTVHYTHPVTRAVTTQRGQSLQLKAADRMTAFAGSMPFVYLHAALFALWMSVFERSPWPTLTLIVSLAAIFLSARPAHATSAAPVA